MTDGHMQDAPLTLDRFVTHAATWHPAVEVVTAHPGAPSRRAG